jgi:hypothetical protein
MTGGNDTSAATIAPLLPCPFCGNKPAIEDRDLAGKAKTIFCAEHDCIGPSTTAASYDDAAMQWNRRAGAAQQPLQPRKTLDEFKEFLDDLADLNVEEPTQRALLAAREYIAEDNNPKSNRVLALIQAALDGETPQCSSAGSDELRRALSHLVEVIDAAGLLNLSNGVQLGPTVWYVKASEAMDIARAALRGA